MTDPSDDSDDSDVNSVSELSDDRPVRVSQVLLVAVALATIFSLWIVPLVDALWFDELGTYWVVKDGLHEAIDRALRFHGQSPFYYVIAWAAVKLGGPHEAVIRLPSTIALLLAVGLLYRLGKRLFDGETGMLAAAIFTGAVGGVCAEARPYALGILVVVAAMLALVRWLDRGRVIDLVLYAALAALTVYVHFLFITTWLVHLLYVLERRRDRAAPLWQIVAAVVLTLALVVPLVPQFLSLFERRASLSFMPAPTPTDLLFTLVPSGLAVGAIAGGVLAWVRFARGAGIERPPGDLTATRLAVLWHVLPSAFIFLVSCVGADSIFVPRYFSCSLPGLALLAAHGLRALKSPLARVIIASCGMVGLATMNTPRLNDWAQASTLTRNLALDATTPVLVPTPAIEGNQLDWLSDPEKRSYLLSPLAFYPMSGDVIVLPRDPGKGVAGYLEQITQAKLKNAKRVVLVAYSYGWCFFWFEGRLSAEGFVARRTGVGPGLDVIVFERP